MSSRDLCDRNCNECPLIGHSNSMMISAVLNAISYEYEDVDELTSLVNHFCPNLTVCPECHTDDFFHSSTEEGHCTPMAHVFEYRSADRGTPALIDELTHITKGIASLTKRFEVVKQILNERSLGETIVKQIRNEQAHVETQEGL